MRHKFLHRDREQVSHASSARAGSSRERQAKWADVRRACTRTASVTAPFLFLAGAAARYRSGYIASASITRMLAVRHGGPDHNNERPVAMTVIEHGTDHKLLILCQRHAEPWDLTSGDEVDDDHMAELCSVELIVAATSAHTREGLDAKERVIEGSDFDRAALAVVSEIVRQDIVRVTMS